MAEDWSVAEVAATVADYFAMLQLELRGMPCIKSDHNRRLQSLLHNRSGPAIEFKHANISAVLIELGFPYIDGYKPRSNYQELLRDEVRTQLAHNPEIAIATQAVVQAAAPVPAVPKSLDEIFVPAPARSRRSVTDERHAVPAPLPRQVNYLELEARNAALGRAGEMFVLEVEHQRLWQAGRRALAKRIEHVAVTRGDGLGFDIVSYEADGRERLIEVKTTAFGSMTPFFASIREVSVSEDRREFHLYRVFRFRDDPKIFSLPGSLRLSCTLDPVQFRANPA